MPYGEFWVVIEEWRALILNARNELKKKKKKKKKIIPNNGAKTKCQLYSISAAESPYPATTYSIRI